MRIWADNSKDSICLIKHLREECKEYSVHHILTASTKPIVNLNGYMIIGFGEICRFFNYDGKTDYSIK